MFDGRTDCVPALSPREVAAWFALGSVFGCVPWWAAHWLADGFDGEALRELAGMDSADPRAMADLLPAVLAELGEDPHPRMVDAAAVVFSQLASDCLAGRLSERDLARQVEAVAARCDYVPEVFDLPLSRLYGVDDEWEGGWGATPEQLRDTVRTRCTEQVASQ